MKDAQGHGSEAQTEQEKDAQFSRMLGGWLGGDKAAAQALATQYGGQRSVLVEFHSASGGPSTPASTGVTDHAAALGKTSQATFGKRDSGGESPRTSSAPNSGSLNRQQIGIAGDAKFSNAGAKQLATNGQSLVKDFRKK